MSDDVYIRPAQPADLEALTAMAERFVAETALPLTFDRENARDAIWTAMCGDQSILLVEQSGEVLAGAVLGFVEADFCAEKCGYITKLYVEKEFRGVGTSQALAEAFEAEARHRGAAVVFASATAGMGEMVEKLYVRLFERIGYEVLGRVVVKVLRDG